MAIKITNRSFSSIFSSADSFLKMNENTKLNYKCDLEFNFDFKSNSNKQVMLNSNDSLKVLNGVWGDYGFVVGDSVTIEYEVIDSSGTVLPVNDTRTIVDIAGDVMTLSSNVVSSSNFIGFVSPSPNNVSVMDISNNTRSVPESLEFYFNLISNSATSGISSLIDGEVNRFKFDDVNIMAISDVITATQLGDKSGGAFDPVITLTRDSTDVYILNINFYNWVRYEQAQFNIEPSAYNANDSLKPYLELEGYAQENNPNAILKRVDSFQLGNAGWIDENYNQGVNNFTLLEYTNEDDDGNSIQGFDYGQPNNITVKVQTSETTIDDKSILLIQHLPIQNYKNNSRSFNENTLSTYSIAESTATVTDFTFDRDGAELDITAQSIAVSGNEITHTIRVVPNADYTVYFDDQDIGDKFVKITIQTKSDGQDDPAVVVAFQGQADIQPPIGDEAEEVTEVDFYNHGMTLGGDKIDGTPDVLTEDDILCHSLMKFNKADNYDAFRVLFRVVNNSTGAFFDLFSRTINLNQYPTAPNGVKLINYNENLGYQLPNPERNVLSLEFTGDEDATTYDVELKHTLLLSWRYWQAKPNALADFLDASLPNNGLNDEWVRYNTTGFSFVFRLELVKDGIADFFNAPQFFIETYDTQSVTTVITYEDLDNNSIPAPLSTQQFYVIATHTAPTAWDINDMWGWIAQRPLENEPRRLNSTAWAYTTANLPLLPEQGETQSTLDVAGNIATVKTLCEGSQLPSDVTFAGRIQSPIKPECTNPLSWLFKYMGTLGANPSDQFGQFIIEARTGIEVDGLCCPECLVNQIDSEGGLVDQFGMAFASEDIIDNELTTLFNKPLCCKDIYEVKTDNNCTGDFNGIINSVYDNIDGSLAVFNAPNQPAQVNIYGSTNWTFLRDFIFAHTTDLELRYDMVEYFVLSGMSIICTEGTTEFKTIRLD